MNECFPEVFGWRPFILMPGHDFTRKPVMGDVLGVGGGNIGQAIMGIIGGVSAGAYKVRQKAIGFIHGPLRGEALQEEESIVQAQHRHTQ